MIQVKINNNLYPATVDGRVSDRDWDGRESKSITMTGDFATVNALFQDGTAWSIVDEVETAEPGLDEEGNPTYGEDGEPIVEVQTVQHEYDNSNFCIRGDLIVHVDGTCTVKMGKETDEETLLMLLYGGEA